MWETIKLNAALLAYAGYQYFMRVGVIPIYHGVGSLACEAATLKNVYDLLGRYFYRFTDIRWWGVDPDEPLDPTKSPFDNWCSDIMGH